MTPAPLFRVESGGLLTTIQDLGRVMHQREGVPAGGAMDPFAASVANLLVGNARNTAVLEVTMIGPTLVALADTRVALCGADLSATVDGEPPPLWWTRTLRAGQTVAFGRRRDGARAYLAVAGGFAVPLVLGSHATLLSARLGGYQGRRLQAGDVLEGSPSTLSLNARGLRPNDVPSYVLPARLGILPGPHREAFTEKGWETLLSGTYVVTPQSDRMGYRLDGPVVERAGGDILSEAMPFGGLQVPPDGQPILLMADRQTTGGYPVIGTVVSADLPRAAQLAPGDGVRFQTVTLEEAQERSIRQERWLRVIGAS